tara:strand:- start:3002 stop:4015 length:1014 start_codon:yes stop_codon:yes gene_type:complete
LDFSVVIPVYKRINLLENCLESIFNQILKPIEIVVVDNNTSIDESFLLSRLINKFKSKSVININIFKSPKNSGAIARNIGVKNVKTDLVAFLDSDVILEIDYYHILIEYFLNKKDLIAIQGCDMAFIESQKKLSKCRKNFPRLLNRFEQIFETSTLLNKKFAYVSPSLAVAHPNVKEEFEVKSQWISTCAGIFKRKLFNRYEFPEQFITYSNNEYLFLSYSLFKNKEGEMIYTSKAKYRDVQTSQGRLNYIPLIFQIEVNDYYIFLKLFDKNIHNLIIFFKSRIGHLIYNLGSLMSGKLFSVKNIFLVLASFIYPIIHINSIKKGDLFFYEMDFYLK